MRAPLTPEPPVGVEPKHDVDLRLAEWLARLMDDYYVDPLLGFLLPGVGDVLGSLVGLLIVGVGVRRGLSRATVARMLLNLGVDGLLGAIPLLGDAFDVVSHANRRNLALLKSRPVGHGSALGDGLYLAGAMVVMLAALVLPVVLLVWGVHSLWRALG
jgi:hypothetical protein